MGEVPFLPAALRDYQEAFEWYQARIPRAADRFESKVAAATAQISQFPESGSPIDDRHRFVLVHQYPYSLIYRVELDRPLIVAVAHAKKAAEDWRTR